MGFVDFQQNYQDVRKTYAYYFCRKILSASEVEVVSLFLKLKIQHIFEIVFLCIHVLFLSIKKMLIC